jgi:hypothetical protein
VTDPHGIIDDPQLRSKLIAYLLVSQGVARISIDEEGLDDVWQDVAVSIVRDEGRINLYVSERKTRPASQRSGREHRVGRDGGSDGYGG